MYCIAHRGFTRGNSCKENSFEAFQNAIDNGFDMIEMDIQLSKDDIIFIHHDTYTNGEKNRNIKWKILSKTNAELLTLEEFFHLFGHYIESGKIQIYLDLKGCEYLAVKLIELLKEKYTLLENICIASFNMKHITILRDLNEDMKIHLKLGFITSSKYSQQIYNEIFNFIDFISVDINIIDNQIIHTAKKNNKKIFVYTSYNENDKLYLQNLNIDGIVSNIIL